MGHRKRCFFVVVVLGERQCTKKRFTWAWLLLTKQMPSLSNFLTSKKKGTKANANANIKIENSFWDIKLKTFQISQCCLTISVVLLPLLDNHLLITSRASHIFPFFLFHLFFPSFCLVHTFYFGSLFHIFVHFRFYTWQFRFLFIKFYTQWKFIATF